MSEQAVPTFPAPVVRTGRRRWTAVDARSRAATRLRRSSGLLGVASAGAARGRGSWAYRSLAATSVRLRRCAPALCAVALLGLIGTGVWATLDQYSEQGHGSSSPQAAQQERPSGSGTTAPGLPTDLTKAAGRASSERQITASPQTTSGAVETGSPSTSISRVATRAAAALLDVARFLLPLLLDVVLGLPAVLVPVGLLRMHRRRRSPRAQHELDPPPGVEDADRDGRTARIEALDEAETDPVEAGGTVDPETEDRGAGLAGAASSADAPGPVVSTDPLAEPEEPRAGERHVLGRPEPAQDLRDVVVRRSSGTSRPWALEDALPEESTSRVSIIGTTIWAPQMQRGPAQVPTQSRSRAGTGPAPHLDVQRAPRPQPGAAAVRLIDQQDALRRRQRAAAQRTRRPAVRPVPTPAHAPVIAAEPEELRRQDRLLQQRLDDVEAAEAGARSGGRRRILLFARRR